MSEPDDAGVARASAVTRRSSFWTITRREALGHARLLAVVLWLVAAILLLVPGPRDPFGTLKGADFLHFYTLGRIALRGDAARLYDGPAQHELQVELVPSSAAEGFIPVYPPQTAVFFAPFSLLPFVAAALLWALVTIAVYALVVSAASRPLRRRPDATALIVAAAAGFPPFWNLVLHGQSTTIPLVAFGLAWAFVAHGRSLPAGLALGLLAVKPQLGLVVAMVVPASRDWRLLLGIFLSLGVQASLSAAVFGPPVLAAWLEVLRELPALTSLLEPRPYQLHSIRALTNLLPAPIGIVAWAVASVVVIWYASRLWNTSQPVAVRMSGLVLATVLVSPHLTVYDATLLALPLVLLADPLGLRGISPGRLWASYYLLYLTTLFPTAGLIGVQVSVLVMLSIFGQAVAHARQVPPAGVIDGP
jgi:hypothetical protein